MYTRPVSVCVCVCAGVHVREHGARTLPAAGPKIKNQHKNVSYVKQFLRTLGLLIILRVFDDAKRPSHCTVVAWWTRWARVGSLSVCVFVCQPIDGCERPAQLRCAF